MVATICGRIFSDRKYAVNNFRSEKTLRVFSTQKLLFRSENKSVSEDNCTDSEK